MELFTLDSLAALDNYVLDMLTLKLAGRAYTQPLHVVQRKIGGGATGREEDRATAA